MTRGAFLVVKICIKCEHGNSFNTGEWKVKGKTASRQKVQWCWFPGVCWLHRQPGTDFQADEARALLLLLPLPEKIDLHWCISLFKSIGLLGNGVLHFCVLLLAFQSGVKPIYLDCQSLQLLKGRLGQLCTVWHLPIFCERPPPSRRWCVLARVEPERCLLSSGPLPAPCWSHTFGTQSIQWERSQSSAHPHTLLHCLEKCYWTPQPSSDNGQAGFATTLWIILLSLHHGRNSASKWHRNTNDLLVLSMDLRWFY